VSASKLPGIRYLALETILEGFSVGLVTLQESQAGRLALNHTRPMRG
jgi:hypothetical protein